MAVSKTSKTTSKTAHVMNLLSRSQSEVPVPHTANSGDEQALEKAPVSQTPPVIASMQGDLSLAAKIKDALELTLDSDEAASSKAVRVERNKKDALTAAAEAKERKKEQAAEEEFMATKIYERRPKVHKAAEEKKEPVQEKEDENVLQCFNIMELLVRSKADKYIELSGICNCERCKNDVIAFSLNNLAPKYVVMPRKNISPRLVVYESKFGAGVTAQILRACNEIMKNPRHEK